MRQHRTVAHPGAQKGRVAVKIARCAVALCASAWLASCSLIYDLSTAQCSTTADCVAKGGVFTELVCVQNLCQEFIEAGCNSNTECIDDAPGNFGLPAACIDRACVPVTSTECPVMLPYDEVGMNNLKSGNPLILGAYASTDMTNGPQIRNYNLALQEFTDELEGLTSADGQRNLVMVVCQGNIQGDRMSLDKSMAHLTKLRVPGVVSALYGDDLQYVFQNFGQAANMFFMSPLEADPALTLLEDGGLIWHALPSAQYVARAYAPLLERTLAYLNVTGGPVRVASVVADDIRFLSDVLETVQDDDFGVRFNGQTVESNRTALNYRSFAITSEYTTTPDVLTEEIAAILAFKPHVIIAAAAGEFLDRMVPTIEASWPTGAGEPPRPFYLLSPLQYNNPAVDRILASNPAVRSRFVGVNAAAAADPTLYNEYTATWDQVYLDAFGVRGYENFYDAAYYMIYAAIAAGNRVDDGEGLRIGMNRLLAGPAFDMGRREMAEAFTALNLPRATITLMGTMGPPDFDPLSGTRASVGSAWCVDNSGTTRADVLRYMDGVMTGSMESCIPNF